MTKQEIEQLKETKIQRLNTLKAEIKTKEEEYNELINQANEKTQPISLIKNEMNEIESELSEIALVLKYLNKNEREEQ